MKSIGIITYHHYYNYGTVLQAYALQKVVEKMVDCNAEIIDYRSHEEKKFSFWKILKIRCRRFFIYFKEWKRVYRLKKYSDFLKTKRNKFELFFKKDLRVGNTQFNSYADLLKDIPIYDIYITGSDQTWSPKIGLNPAMFLKFAPLSAKKIAYAPSLGVSSLKKEEIDTISNYLDLYKYISCREKVGCELLHSCTNKDVHLVLDPTLLLTNEDWNRIANPVYIKKPFILCYFIGHRFYYREFARKLSRIMNIPLYYIPVSWVDLEKNNNFIPDAGPKEFLGLIRDASFILTDSYHGTVFSINYHKDFYSFFKAPGGISAIDNSRISDILIRLGLMDRLKDEVSIAEYIAVDYSKVNIKLSEERESSFNFLKEALS